MVDLYESANPTWNRATVDSQLVAQLPRWQNDTKGLSKALNAYFVAKAKKIGSLISLDCCHSLTVRCRYQACHHERTVCCRSSPRTAACR